MRAFVTVYSKVFLELQDDSWSARPSPALMRRLHSGEGSARWIAYLGENRISMGDPVTAEYTNQETLYVPQWFIETIGIEDGDSIEVQFERSEDLTRATSLSFKVIGDIPNDLDIRDLLEEPLSQLGVLHVGQVIPVPALEGVLLLLEKCEPDGVVFLDGADIALDIIPETPPASPLPFVALPPQIDFDEPLVSSLPISRFPPKFIPFQGTGNRLG
jgi:hypothetical protein